MYTRIERDFVFQAGVHFEGKFLLNIYDMSVSMLVETESIREQNIAMERIKYFLHECLENSVFVCEANKEAIELYSQAGIKVCTLPEEPYDQIISMILLLKLNAIMENRMKITDVVLGSKLSDGVRFNVVIEMAENVFSGTHWWDEPSTCMRNENKSQNKKNKIVKLFDPNEWSTAGLNWKEKTKTASDKKSVVEPENQP